MSVSNIPNYDVQELLWDDDDTFFASTPAIVNTFANRIPHRAARWEPASNRSPSDGSRQSRFAHSRPGYILERGGSLEIDEYLCGAQVDTATGSLVATGLYTRLKDGLGGGQATDIGGLAGASATTTAIPNGTGTHARGTILRVGQARDAGGDGQAVVMGAGTAFLNALPAAPGATDKLRACLMVWLAATLGTAKRFLLGWAQTGEQYAVHGCQLEKVTITQRTGELPMLTTRYMAAYWERVDGFSIPSAVSLPSCDAHISAGGSAVLQTVGTTTRAQPEATEWELSINTALVPHRGQGGISGLQPVTGWSRTKAGQPDDPIATLRLRIRKEQAMELEYDADGSDSVLKYFLHTMSRGEGTDATEGRHAALFLPSIYYMDKRPTPIAHNGLLYQDVMFGIQESADTTSEMSQSAVRIGLS